MMASVSIETTPSACCRMSRAIVQAMTVTQSYREYIAEQLASLGVVTLKRMFGGVGLYYDGKMFGLIDDDTVYLRVDDATRPDYSDRGMPPFRPMKREPSKVSLNYYQVPGDVIDDAESMVAWARRAVSASRQPTARVAAKLAAAAAPQRRRSGAARTTPASAASEKKAAGSAQGPGARKRKRAKPVRAKPKRSA